ncbi:Txe/YoeB family addiction module toxin [Belnapia sp. T6]|uniref:Putative mRNA interferase YoeB n=1 Tax=Belnapia mucosa TaxID=2804532 RepID=A0ABS1VAA8_9PROT|nr:Txe/YoeB family addiction module toxin [Belnapia mucosa]MBL6458583.1 Txe/YoeB family addiction module toxin [Belnapia mucosa]
MEVRFAPAAWADLRHWAEADREVFFRLLALIEDARRNPFRGLGKPEPLRGEFAGWWSRRITGEHRLVYRVAGKPGEDQRIEVAQCRYHYG